MKEFILKLIVSMKFLKPLFKMILAKNEDKIIDLVNEHYDNKNMTEEEEKKAIKEIFDKLIKLI